jgi:hypothetical protein
MLITGFTLEGFDAIEAEDVKDTLPASGIGIVREETIGCTMVADQIFKGLRHVRFKAHGIDRQQSWSWSCQHRVVP